MKIPNHLSALFLFVSLIVSGQDASEIITDYQKLNQAADKYLEAHDHEKALETTGRLLELARESSDSSLLLLPMAKFANIYFSLRDITKAEKYFDRLFKLSEQYRDTVKMIEALDGKASVRTLKGYHYEAVMFYEKAEKLAEISQSKKLHKIRLNKAISLTHLGLNKEVLENILQSIEHFKETGDSITLATAYNNLGELYREKLNEPDNALKHYRMAVRINQALNHQQHLSMNYNNIGIVFTSKEQYDSAQYYLRRSYNLKIQLKERGGEAIAAFNLGSNFLKQGNAEEAEKYLNEARKIATEMKIPPGIFYSHRGLAGVAKLRNDQTSRLENLLIAKETSDSLDIIEMDLGIRDELYNYHKDNGDFRQANAYLEELNFLLDSLRIENPAGDITELKAVYEKELSEAENKILRTGRQRSEAHLKATQRESEILIISIVALVIIAGLLFIGLMLRNRRFREQESLKNKLQERNAMLAEQENKLKELNHIKNRIFSILGHDLRAPLSTLSSYMDLLQLGGLPEEEHDKIMTHLKSETNITLKTLENILAWARLQMNEKNETRVKTDLSYLVEDIRELFTPVAANKKVDLRIRTKGNLNLIANEYQLRSLISNLVSNAIKFTPENSRVCLYVFQEENQIEIIVSDEGEGISIEALEAVYAGKVVKSNHGTRGERGTGIGLNLVKEFVDAHHGKMIFQPNSNRGTVVKVIIPVDGSREELPVLTNGISSDFR